MVIERVGTATGISPDRVRYRASGRMILESVEAVNRSAPCHMVIMIAPAGFTGPEAGVAIAEGISDYAGFGVRWSGEMELLPDEEVVGLYSDCTAGHIIDLTLKARARGIHG